MRVRQLRALVLVAAVVLAGQAAAKKPSAPPTTYKARRGDTLSLIAKRYHTTVAVLSAANDLPDPNRIRAGQVLSLVPKPAPVAPAADPTAAHKPIEAAMSDAIVVVGANGTSTYVVVKNDNLAKIAARFSTTAADLAKLNNIKLNKALRIGTTLNVPGGEWKCPVAGAHQFGDSWRQPRAGGRQHMGTDVFAFKGTPVIAPVSGTLELRKGSIGGNAFYLKGVDGVTYYGAHLDTITAPAGPLKAGDQIGTVGNTGNADGGTPHLHFEIHPNGVAVNPYPTLKRWC